MAGQASAVDCYTAPGVTPSFYAGCGTAGDPSCAAQYWPHGAIQSVKLGNGVTESTTYNNRLQMLTMTAAGSTTLLGLTYAYPPGNGTQQIGNNGSLNSQTIHYDATGPEAALTLLQTYPTYDSVNRLTGFTEGSINQVYDYDVFGNRWVDSTSSSGFSLNPLTPTSNTYNAANNRLGGIGYDARGNQTQLSPFSMSYDGENRQTSAVSSINGSGSYEYDGDGRRVRKRTCTDATACTAMSNGLKTTMFVYDAFGQLAAEYGPPSTSAGPEFYTADHLGSTRLVTDAQGSVKERYDYLPFGEGLGPGVNGRSATYANYNAGAFPAASDGESVKFTGKERDAETGLDFFEARYMSSAQGRFTSPDPSGLLAQKPQDPQSWNMYAYVRNNPLVLIDPNGLDCVYANDGHGTVGTETNSNDCGANSGTWVPGTVDQKNIVYNKKTGLYQVASLDGQSVNYATFAAGATTAENGSCISGCKGAEIQSANASWLSSMIVGGSLDQMMGFMVGRTDAIHGVLFNGPAIGRIGEQMISGPLDFWNDRWAGPAGMGPPQGQGDWTAMVHDYNFDTNGIRISSYFNPAISKETAKALIQSNSNLIRNAGGVQGAKMGLFFGVVNAFQWVSHLGR
jgi:RHS repeat-associated protein